MGNVKGTRSHASSVVARLLAGLAGALLFLSVPVGCGGDDGDDDGTDMADAGIAADEDANPTIDAMGDLPDALPDPDRLWIVPWEAAVCPGQRLDMKATAIYETDEGEVHVVVTELVNWSTDHPGTATVDENGRVTGVATGNTIVRGELGGAEDTTELEIVADEISGLIIQPNTVSVAAGLQQNFKALTVTTCGNTNPVTVTAEWSSTVLSVAEVLAPGIIQTKLRGSSTIEASWGEYTAEASLGVSVAVPDELSVSPDMVSVGVGEATELTAEVTLTNGEVIDVTAEAVWASVVPGIVEVTGPGEITGVDTGGTEVKATYEAEGVEVTGSAAAAVTGE